MRRSAYFSSCAGLFLLALVKQIMGSHFPGRVLPSATTTTPTNSSFPSEDRQRCCCVETVQYVPCSKAEEYEVLVFVLVIRPAHANYLRHASSSTTRSVFSTLAFSRRGFCSLTTQVFQFEFRV